MTQNKLDSLLEHDWGFPLSAQDIAALQMVATADSRGGHRLVVDQQATFFYRQIRLTLEPTMSTQQAQAEARVNHLLSNTGLPTDHSDIELVEPPAISTLYYPHTTLNSTINNLTRHVQGMVKYCSVYGQHSRWLYAPAEMMGGELWTLAEVARNAFLFVLDRIDLLYYTDYRSDILTGILHERQARRQLTVLTVTSPRDVLRDWWLTPTIAASGLTWTGWGPIL